MEASVRYASGSFMQETSYKRLDNAIWLVQIPPRLQPAARWMATGIVQPLVQHLLRERAGCAHGHSFIQQQWVKRETIISKAAFSICAGAQARGARLRRGDLRHCAWDQRALGGGLAGGMERRGEVERFSYFAPPSFSPKALAPCPCALRSTNMLAAQPKFLPCLAQLGPGTLDWVVLKSWSWTDTHSLWLRLSIRAGNEMKCRRRRDHTL